MTFRIFEPCRTGDHHECVGNIAQQSERSGHDALVAAQCSCACHEEERDSAGGEA